VCVPGVRFAVRLAVRLSSCFLFFCFFPCLFARAICAHNCLRACATAHLCFGSFALHWRRHTNDLVGVASAPTDATTVGPLPLIAVQSTPFSTEVDFPQSHVNVGVRVCSFFFLTRCTCSTFFFSFVLSFLIWWSLARSVA
jgi:hypothetical protein